VVLDWQVTGYLAAVTAALGQARIPVGVLSSFHHDHLIVQDQHLAPAVVVLERLIDAARAAPDHAGPRQVSPNAGT
ncbi:MAG: ACT domain-containing protein, partial [bacterium]